MKTGPLVFAGLAAALLAIRWRRLSGGQRGLLAALAAALAVYGIGLVQPPDLESTIEDLGRTLGPYTYAFVGAMAFLETGAGVGLIAPGEFTVMLGGVIAGQGRIDVVALIAIVWVAAVAGDVTSYVLGRRLGRGFLVRHGPRVKITPDRLEQVEAFFHRHGGATILIGRFIGLVRAIAPFLAGASRMPLRRFLPYDTIAAGIWGGGFVLVGYVFWQSFHQVVAVAKQGAVALGAVVVATGGVVLAVRHLRDSDNREALRATLAAERRPGLRTLARAALAAEARLARAWRLAGRLGLEVLTLIAVLLAGGVAFAAAAVAVDRGTRLASDRIGFELGADVRAGAVTDVARAVTALGSTAAVAAAVIVAIGLLAWRRRLVAAVTLAAGALATSGAVQLVKALEDRHRPPAPLVRAGGASFPSGHAAHAIVLLAVAVALAPSLPGGRARTALLATAAVLAVAIGLTRVYLRVHYLSDVIGGWGLAAATLAACALTARLVGAVRQNDAGR